ncbi:hypothetical protein SmJEL517_g02634 [Synchytrium microbalum]|uniref:PIPK domain-containing protein n=1 Tax=Synchytrium microbalum TaxID=1806994 RepID=A0A507C5T1_9FUNG|nr:uncharacterized protein SmJEL517_g02634 [Synchytrium microbalum]TPX34861.1 hypothetical protein SmJEL517_g02634 [Synchytrium microbalum]
MESSSLLVASIGIATLLLSVACFICCKRSSAYVTLQDDDEAGIYDPLLSARRPSFQRPPRRLLEPPTVQLLRHGIRISLMAASTIAATRSQTTSPIPHSRKRRRQSTSPATDARSSRINEDSPRPSLQHLFDPLLRRSSDGGRSRIPNRCNTPTPVTDGARKGKTLYISDDDLADQRSFALPTGLSRASFLEDSSFEMSLPELGRMKLTEHAPLVFIHLRKSLNLTHQELYDSLSRPFIIQQSPGQSGSFFLKTTDRRYLFKTLRGSEHESLKAFLPAYLDFVSSNPHTFLPRYFGCYTFEKLPGERVLSGNGFFGSLESVLGSRFTLIAMTCVYDTDLSIHQRFDFKGSNVGRQAIQNLLGYVSRTSSLSSATLKSSVDDGDGDDDVFQDSEVTLKELDFWQLLAIGHTGLLHVGKENKGRLIRQLEKDVALLKSHAFMDYSLLIGIHRRERVQPSFATSSSNPSFRQHRSSRVPDTWPRHASVYSSIRSIRSNIPTQAATFFMWLVNGSASESGQSSVEDAADDEATPFHKQYHGGLKSVGMMASDVEYEIYYIGIIDILQRFNFSKWVERGLKRQASFLTEQWRGSESDEGLNSPKSPTLQAVSPTNHSTVWEGIEHSVEEPQRYASRLVDFVTQILD